MESKNFFCKGLAVLAIMYLTGSFFVGIGTSIVYPIRNPFDWGIILLALILLVLHWIAVLKADKSTIWAIILMILAIFIALPAHVEVLIIGTIHFLYSIVSLVKISYKNLKRK